MNWLQRYRIRNYFRSSIWILPFLGIVASFVLARLIVWIDKRLGLESSIEPGSAREFLGGLAASIFTLIVFVSSTLLLAVQLASAQLTPRVISLFFKDNVIKWALTIFVSTFTFSLMVAVRVGESVPILAGQIAAFSCLASISYFFFMIDHVGKFLRPSGVLSAVAIMGRQVIQSVYPRPFSESANGGAGFQRFVGEPSQTIISQSVGVVLALDVRGLVLLAEKHNCVIEMLPQVGDYVAIHEPLFQIHYGGSGLPPSQLYNSLAIGMERTIEQDPAFAFRIMVDIASKGLSPAINDPTTAVLAIDQIHRLLQSVGHRRLDEGHVFDAKGRLRLVYRTPDWEDFVHLAVTEIRQFGGVSIQVTRRLRAMLENLVQTLPGERAPILREELRRLRRSAERYFPDTDDLAMADVSDSQGVGGKGVPSQVR